MKKIKNLMQKPLVGIIALALTVSSCSGFLDEEPLNQKTDGTFWTSAADAQAAVNMIYYGGVPYLYGGRENGWQPTRLMYSGLLSGLFTDQKGDGNISGRVRDLNITFQSVGEVNELYREPYVCIGRCNVLIARIPGMVAKGIITETQKNEFLAQAYFFRAWSYYFLLKEFGCKDGEAKDGGNGGVPLILEPIETADPTVINKPRASITEVYTQIEKDLQEAIKALPNTTFYANKCRITKPAAQALLATVYLQWAGYPLQNTAKYAEAAAMAEAVISGGAGHDLEASDDNGAAQKSAFNKIKNSKSSKEIIYAIEYEQLLDRGNGYINACMTNAATSWKKADGKTNVFKTSVLANMYHAEDAVIKSYVDGDVRIMEKNFFFQTYTSAEGLTYDCDQYDNWFWFEDYAMVNTVGSSLNFPVFRLSEMHLIAAEAYLKQTSPDQAKAKAHLEIVKKRAFTVNGVLSSKYSLPATITIDDVLTERLHEFPLELKVWDDIRRNHLYPQLQSDMSLKWVDIASATIYNKSDGKSFSNNMHMLIWPFSDSALDRNPSLSQNPGY